MQHIPIKYYYYLLQPNHNGKELVCTVYHYLQDADDDTEARINMTVLGTYNHLS